MYAVKQFNCLAKGVQMNNSDRATTLIVVGVFLGLMWEIAENVKTIAHVIVKNDSSVAVKKECQ